MFRFTIRDVLWLTVVAGLLISLAISNIGRIRATEECEREKTHLEQCLVDAARNWAKEKGETVAIDAGGYIIEATPSGQIRLLSKVIRQQDITPPKK
jgi:hypothetical protein